MKNTDKIIMPTEKQLKDALLNDREEYDRIIQKFEDDLEQVVNQIDNESLHLM